MQIVARRVAGGDHNRAGQGLADFSKGYSLSIHD